jgi:hypothetical protein
MARGHRRAAQPTPEQLAAREEAKRAARAQSSAPPPERVREPGVMKTYRVVGNRICHGKNKGDLVDLWDTGATRALVQAGHLVEVVEEKDRGHSADEVKEADNG